MMWENRFVHSSSCVEISLDLSSTFLLGLRHYVQSARDSELLDEGLVVSPYGEIRTSIAIGYS